MSEPIQFQSRVSGIKAERTKRMAEEKKLEEGIRFAQAKEFDQAYAIFSSLTTDKDLEGDPIQFEAYYLLGKVCCDTNKWDEGAAALKKALALVPGGKHETVEALL